jgi:ZIP family zinc transporter/zinc and cadmium transporter
MHDSPGPALVVLLGVLAGLSNLVGGALALLRPRFARRHFMPGLAFSGGFLMTVAVVDILPEALAARGGGPPAPLLVLAGYLVVYLAEHLFAGHAHDLPGTGHAHEGHGAHPLIGARDCREERAQISPSAAAAAATGLTVHSFFDGAAIAAALAASTPVGWLTFFAVLTHKLPEGFSLASIRLSSRGTRRSAFLQAALLGGASLAGTLAVVGLSRRFLSLEGPVLAVACGMFLHIAATDLLPTTGHVKGLKVLAATLAGAAVAIVAAALLRLALG